MSRAVRLDTMPLAMVGAATVMFAPGVEALWRHAAHLGDTWWVPADRIVIHHQAGTRWVATRYTDPVIARRWAELLVETALHLQHIHAERKQSGLQG